MNKARDHSLSTGRGDTPDSFMDSSEYSRYQDNNSSGKSSIDNNSSGKSSISTNSSHEKPTFSNSSNSNQQGSSNFSNPNNSNAYSHTDLQQQQIQLLQQQVFDQGKLLNLCSATASNSLLGYATATCLGWHIACPNAERQRSFCFLASVGLFPRISRSVSPHQSSNGGFGGGSMTHQDSKKREVIFLEDQDSLSQQGKFLDKLAGRARGTRTL